MTARPVFAFGSSSLCIDLFRGKPDLTNLMTVERRNSDSPMVFIPPVKTLTQGMDTACLPDRTRVVMDYEKQPYYKDGYAYERHQLRAYEESVVVVNGQLRVFRDEIPMDPQLPFVINANLDKGRRLYDRSLEKGRGIVLFIDVNDLGWINKNFKNGSIDGDHFVLAVSKAIQSITTKKGLAFRLGGDEFGILIPIVKPELLNEILKTVQAETKKYAESIFRKEQERRWTAYQAAKSIRDTVRKMPKNFSQEQIDTAEANFLIAQEQMNIFVYYSQPNIAIGATYYGGWSAEVIQKEVEQNAHPHKMAVKKSNHASIGKYVSNPDEVNYVKGPLFVIDYEFPLLEDRTQEPAPHRSRVDFNKPQIQWKRERVLYRVGHYNIAEYKSEHGVFELKVETWKDGQIQDLTDLPIHKHTQLFDAQSQIAQDLMSELKSSQTYIGLWINLLNLGKMNYFKDKSKTGDVALARISKIMRDFFNQETAMTGKKRLGFKLRGSEFLFFVESYESKDLMATLNFLINSDPVIQKIYKDQMDYLVSQRGSGLEQSEKIEELRKMMTSPFVEIRER